MKNSLSEKELRKIIRKSLLEEGFFDLKDSPTLQKLGVVNKPRPQQSTMLPGPVQPKVLPDPTYENDPWVKLELDIGTAISQVTTKYRSRVGEEQEDEEDFMIDLGAKIARHLDFDKDGATGDKDDILISFERLADFEIDFIDNQDDNTRNLGEEFCNAVKNAYGRNRKSIYDLQVLARDVETNRSLEAMGTLTNTITNLKRVFKEYLNIQSSVNRSLLLPVLNKLSQEAIKRNFKNIIMSAIQESPSTFSYESDDLVSNSGGKGKLSFPLQIEIVSDDATVGSTYFKVSCILDFNDVYDQLNMSGQSLFGDNIENIEFRWSVLIESVEQPIADVVTLSITQQNLNYSSLVSFVKNIPQLAKDIIALNNTPASSDIDFFSGNYVTSKTLGSILTYDRTQTTFDTPSEQTSLANDEENQVIIDTGDEQARIQARAEKRRIRAEEEIEAKRIAAEKLAAHQHARVIREKIGKIRTLKSEQGQFFRFLRADSAYKAMTVSKRMIEIIETIKLLPGMSDQQFMLGDYLMLLKKYNKAEMTDDTLVLNNIKADIMSRNLEINKKIKNQIKLITSQLLEALNYQLKKLIIERVHRRIITGVRK